MADRVDVVIVGGGLAGLAAAAGLAQAGIGVRLYDRGHFEGRPGGGIVSGTTLGPLGGPSVPMEVPFDRDVGERRWLFLTRTGEVALDFLDAPSPMPSEGLHTVRTSTLAPWLAERARTLGADLRPGTAVDGLRREGRGPISGVRVRGADVEALVTILADGGSLRATPNAPLRRPSAEVAEAFWTLPARSVSARLGARAGSGTVIEALFGELSPEGPAGGYLLPFRSGIAVGAVVGTTAAPPGGAEELLGRFERHPSVTPLVQGGQRGAVTKTQLADRPEIGRPLSGEGFLAVGTAGGLAAVSATRFLAVDAALRSGAIAGEVARDAVINHDASALRLSAYPLSLGADGLL
ncbi:MAG TPA: FAD-dependent monooxygenase, partial [Thermoplasmata archaeon]|nr:FAD-dependent monooxygenase [Thermoplasmata archaeon]